MSEIPSNWQWSTIGDVSAYIQRGKSPKYTVHSDLPIINQKCIRWEELQLQHLKYIHPDQFSAWDESRFIKPGDILWNSTGTGTVGRAYLVKDADCVPPKVVDSHVTIVRASAKLESRYLFNWIKSPAVQSKIEEMCDGTTNQIELSKSAIAATAIPIAPCEEQIRIANQLDSLLTHIQICNDRIDATHSFLKRLRQAVLVAAQNGDLTSDWRLKNGVAKAELDQVSRFLKVSSGKFLPAKDMAPIGTIPVFGGNGINGYHDQGNIYEETIVIGRVGFYCGSVHLTPKVAWVTDNALIVRHNSEETNRKYLFYALQAINLRENEASTAQPAISGQKIYPLRLRVPTLPEQREIVRRIEVLFALADRIESRANAVRTHAQRLGSLVLSKAFRGELVQQNSEDEPVEMLLSQIASHKSQASKRRIPPAVLGRKEKMKLKTGYFMDSGEQTSKVNMELDSVSPNHLELCLSDVEGLNAKQLWQKSKLGIDDFYFQLSKEVGLGFLEIDSNDEPIIRRRSANRKDPV
jgi:type I restriction enzyme S subunit